MRNTFTRKEFALAAACALALGMLSATASAQVPSDQKAPSGAAAPLPVWEKVMFDANVLFDSDKPELRAAGRDALDAFLAKIHGLDSQRIMVIGHADRMGSHAANQTLSQQRVDAVKAYLVGKGIASDRVQTSARGETQPDRFAGNCKVADNAKNIACMQPDRHVFIEVSGSRIAK